jgi:hypothetical protein
MYGNSVAASGSQTRAEAAIDWGTALLRERASAAHAVGLPLLLEELNWKPASTSDRDSERAQVVGAWLAAARELGVGTLPWMIGELDRMDYDGYLIRPDDEQTVQQILCGE